MEIWKQIQGLDGNYEVSNIGRVRSVAKVVLRSNGRRYNRVSKVLQPALDPNGYFRCAVSHENKLITLKVHRLVCTAFHDNQENKPFVNHKDCNSKNNHADNLEWCTHKENSDHAIANGRIQMVADDALRKRSVNKTIKSGELNGFSLLTEIKVKEIRTKFIPNVYTRQMLADDYGVTVGCIKDVLSRKSWRNVK